MAFELLGVRIDQISKEDLWDTVAEKLLGDKFFQISTVNPEFLVRAFYDPDFSSVLARTHLHVCDGIGMFLWGRILYGQKVERIPGVEIAENICRICAEKNISVYFLGGFGGYAEKAKNFILQKYPSLRVVGVDSEGHANDSITLQRVIDAQPQAILVAFGAPKQEKWLLENAPHIPSLRLGIGVGGTFDFWGGKIQRAPLCFQKLGLEWLYRLFQEPRVRAVRIFRAVFVFSFLVVSERIRKFF